MKKALILTRTNWNEPPRIRHQITRLLKEKGYDIVYIEKNTYKSLFIKKRKEESITFYSHAELIHHQLRCFPIIQKLNNFVVKKYLKKIMKEIEFDFIMNFCYEYDFLKLLAPNKKIISMMEDDFEAQAKFWMTKAIRNQIKSTCRHSDGVLTVSYPLFEKLERYKKNVTMFFPWSQRRYVAPKKNVSKRNTVLYFGFVGRLDWVTVEELIRITDYNYRFIGPIIRRNDSKMVDHLKRKYNNFEYIPFSKIEDIEIADVFCSILPYNVNLGNVQACTISNRAFNLLSLGLPLVYADLKNIIKTSKNVIRTNKSLKDYERTLGFYHENFYTVQKDIEGFLENHYKDSRWQVLEKIIND